MTTAKRKPAPAVLDFGDRMAVRRQVPAIKPTRRRGWSKEASRREREAAMSGNADTTAAQVTMEVTP